MKTQASGRRYEYWVRDPVLEGSFLIARGESEEQVKKNMGLDEEVTMHRNEPDHCFYCGKHYLPMTVFIHPSFGKRVWVHTLKVEFEPKGITVKSDDTCRKLAFEDGFVERLDLTPKR